MFHNFQQKQVSTLLQVLWAEDPFKAKWAILAKAYSMIRDRVGKEDAPLDNFLDLCCPEIGIISINEYLNKLNWVVGSNAKGELTLTQTEAPDFANFEAELTNCSMNEIDVIEFCVAEGFFPDLDPFAEYMTNNPNHLMGVVTMKPGQAKRRFLAAISADPKAVAAQILGWDVDHEFFKISTDLTIPAVGAAINMADHPGLVDHLDLMEAEYPQVPEMTQLEDHVWTGSMSELYRPTETSIEFDSVTAPEKWSSTDIGNPTALDGSLQAAGYDPNVLNPNGKFFPPLRYQHLGVADSFFSSCRQCRQSRLHFRRLLLGEYWLERSLL
jgi:hypothetical protein